MKKTTKKRIKGVFAVLCCLSVFITSYLLMYPASTAESQAFCGLVEHKHDENCYEMRLICGLEEAAVSENNAGTATETAPGEDTAGTAGGADIPEETTAPQHTHTDACYERVLICPLPEHTHDTAC